MDNVVARVIHPWFITKFLNDLVEKIIAKVLWQDKRLDVMQDAVAHLAKEIRTLKSPR